MIFAAISFVLVCILWWNCYCKLLHYTPLSHIDKAVSSSCHKIHIVRLHQNLYHIEMKVSQAPKLSNANVNGKGHRPPKFSAPPVTSVEWKTVGQAFLSNLAAKKLGGSANLPSSSDEINKIAFGCYSAKELPFILQALGFSSEYGVTKKQLLKQVVATFYAIHSMSNVASHDGGDASLTKSSANTSSSASLVSTSPHYAASTDVNGSIDGMDSKFGSRSPSNKKPSGSKGETKG